MRIPLSSPDISPEDVEAVVAVLNSRWLSLGPQVEAFEAAAAEVAGRAHGVAVNSGTSALHLGVEALGLPPGTEVITTPFSFVASANCLLFCGLKPVFVDIDPDTYNVDPDQVEAAITPRTGAILGVDVFGQPARWDRLTRIAEQHGLRLIEDSAEAIGATYLGRPAGGWGDFGVFAFYPNKQMTTGEGGVLVTDDARIAAHARSARNQGRGEGGAWLLHERLGYNFRLSELHSALGLSQIARLPQLLARRAEVAGWYDARLGGVRDLHLLGRDPDARISWFVYVVRLGGRFAQADRDRVIAEMRGHGIQCSNYFAPIHLQPFYREMGFCPGQFPVTESVGARTLALPFFNRLSEAEADEVADRLLAVAGLERG